jgi:hypothetical protein
MFFGIHSILYSQGDGKALQGWPSIENRAFLRVIRDLCGIVRPFFLENPADAGNYIRNFYLSFCQALLVGYGINALCRNRMNYKRGWFRQRTWESALYRVLKVKNGRAKCPRLLGRLSRPPFIRPKK